MARAVTSKVLHVPDRCEVKAEEGDHLMLHLKYWDADASVDSEPFFQTESWEQQHVQLGDSQTSSTAFDQGLQDVCEGEIRELVFTSEEFGSLGPTTYSRIRAKVEVRSMTKAADFVIFSHLKQGQISEALEMIDKHVGVNAVDEYGHTPLMAAVQMNLSVVIASLLNSWKPKVDVNFAKPSGHSVLFYAVAQPVGTAGTTMLKALLKRGADPNLSLIQPDSNGWTPLHFACKFENIKVAQLLLDYGANALAQSTDGQTVLDAAADAPYSVRKKLADILNEAVARMDPAIDAGPKESEAHAQQPTTLGGGASSMRKDL